MLFRKSHELITSRILLRNREKKLVRSKCEGKSEKYYKLEEKYNAHNYKPVPVVLSKGKGIFVWDVEGKRYFDFICGISVANQGHCHPKIVKTLCEQAKTLTITSRAFYNDALGEFCEKIATLFEYDKVLPSNAGVESCDAAVKLARKWGYEKKKIPKNKAIVLFPEGNYWGRSLSAISASTKPVNRKNFGPYMPGFNCIKYNDLCELEEALKDPCVCAYMVEPILGEAGIIVPDDGYLTSVRELCTANNVLMIADEVQTGLSRTGKLLCCHHECVRPDLITLGKSLAGGLFPVSAVLADDEVMMCLSVGTHGSTFGGNPLACRVAMTALDVILEENLAENAEKMGQMFREAMCSISGDTVTAIRGKGLLNAIDLNEKYLAWHVVLKLRDKGVLCKDCSPTTIRFMPPLIITEEQMCEALDIITGVLNLLC